MGPSSNGPERQGILSKATQWGAGGGRMDRFVSPLGSPNGKEPTPLPPARTQYNADTEGCYPSLALCSWRKETRALLLSLYHFNPSSVQTLLISPASEFCITHPSVPYQHSGNSLTSLCDFSTESWPPVCLTPDHHLTGFECADRAGRGVPGQNDAWLTRCTVS